MNGDNKPTNIGNPNEFTVRQLAELVIELTGTKSRIVQRELPVDDPRFGSRTFKRPAKCSGGNPWCRFVTE